MFVHRFLGKLRLLTLAIPLSLSLTLALPLTASAHTLDRHQIFFEQTNLVSNQAGAAQQQDGDLVNAWGIVAVPDGPFWIADNGTSVATAYDGKGNFAQPHRIVIGTAEGPTGVVFNQTDDFKIGDSRPAKLLFDTETGKIFGWNPQVDLNNAIPIPVDNSPGAVYKGLAQGRVGSHDFLFATDFFNRHIDVFDAHFGFEFSFTDTDLTSMCHVSNSVTSCFSPFGIRNIGGKLFVTFALQNGEKQNHDDLAGVGNGFVDVFSTSGKLLKRLVPRKGKANPLDSPWGLALAPDNFGKFSHALLVGNFGHVSDTEPSINAFDIKTGKFLGSLLGTDHHPVHIDGLWGLTFGDDVRNADPDTLYFTAGPNDENDGLFGFLAPED